MDANANVDNAKDRDGIAAFGTQAAAANLTPVPSANSKSPGIAAPNNLYLELAEKIAAHNSTSLDNPNLLRL